MMWSFVAAGSYAASNWLLIVFLAKFGGAELVGKYSISLAIVTPAFMLSSLQLRQLQATDVSNEFEFCDYFGLRILTTTIVALIVVGLSATYPHDIFFVVAALSSIKIIEWVSDIFFGFFKPETQNRLNCKNHNCLRGLNPPSRSHLLFILPANLSLV